MSHPPTVVVRPTLSGLTGADDLVAIEALTGTGIAARTGTNTWALRTLQPPAAGITITNPAGTAGDPTLVLANDLAALEGLSSTGMIARTGDGTAAVRTITGTANRVTITDGSGVSGNPTADIAATYVGQTSITTLGTVATGTWNATAIGVSKGGTGLTATPTNGQLPIGNGSGYTLATLTAGTGISVSNASGSITITSSAGDVAAQNVVANGGFDIWQRGSIVFGAPITGDTTSGSATVSNVSSVASLSVGMSLSGTGITAGTTVASIVSSTSFTMSANATATGSSVAIYPGADDNMSTGADRWFFLSDGAQLNGLGERVSHTGLSVYAGKFTNRTSGRCGIIQWLDAKTSRPLRSKSLYFGCKVYADNNAITVRCAIIGWSGTDDTLGASRDPVNDWTSGTFTTGNFFKSTSFSVIGTGSVTASSSFETLSCSGTASSAVTNLAVLVWKDAANTIPLTVSEADFYNGTTSRTFVPAPTSHDLAECERFFYKTFALGTQPVANIGNNQGVEQIYPSTTFGGCTVRYRQRMHRVPTMTIYNPQSASAGITNVGTARDITSGANRTVTLGTSTDTGVTAEITSGVVADTRNVFHFVADAEIA